MNSTVHFTSLHLSHSDSPVKFVVPSCLRLSSNQHISQTNKNLVVELSDIMGGSIGPFDVRVSSITDPSGTEMRPDKLMTAGDDK